MAAVFDAASYNQYLPMADDNTDDLEAQLHHELYGDDSLFAAPAPQDETDTMEEGEGDAQGELSMSSVQHEPVEEENVEEGEEVEEEEEGEEKAHQQPDTDIQVSTEDDETVGAGDNVTGYNERDATLMENETGADVAEHASTLLEGEAEEAALVAGPSSLQVPASADNYDVGTPASMAFTEEPPEPTPILIMLPGYEEPYHLCADQSPSVLGTRKDLYRKTVADLFVALRADPLLHDRFAGDWKEMTLSIPELQLILHEDDGYSSQVRLVDLVTVHTAFCTPPVKFVLGEQHRFEYRFQAYAAEAQRRLEANESLSSHEPFDPEAAPFVATETASITEAAQATENADDAQHDMEEEYGDEHKEDPQNDDEELHIEAAHLHTNANEETNEEDYENDESKLEGVSETAVFTADGPTTDSIEEMHDELDVDGNEGNASDVGDDVDGEEDLEEGEESFVHIQSVDDSLAEHVPGGVEEPAHELAGDGAEIEQVEYEYVDEDGNVLIEGYDTVTVHEHAAEAVSATEALEIGGQSTDGTTTEPHESAPVVDAEHLLEPTDIVESNVEDFDLEAALETEYNKSSGSNHDGASQADHLDEEHDDIALDHTAADAAEHSATNGFEAPVNGEIADEVVTRTLAGEDATDGSPTSISGVKRQREEDDAANAEDGLEETDTPQDSNKRPRVV